MQPDPERTDYTARQRSDDVGYSCFELLGFDVLIDECLKPWLLEVNSHCALGDGTMSAVDPSVYTRLVRDVVSAIVLRRASARLRFASPPPTRALAAKRKVLSACGSTM